MLATGLGLGSGGRTLFTALPFPFITGGERLDTGVFYRYFRYATCIGHMRPFFLYLKPVRRETALSFLVCTPVKNELKSVSRYSSPKKWKEAKWQFEHWLLLVQTGVE